MITWKQTFQLIKFIVVKRTLAIEKYYQNNF